MRGILGEGDSFLYHFPYRLFSITLFKKGVIPLWNPYLLCGFPQLAALQTSVLYPPNIFFFSLFPPVIAFNLTVLFHFSLAGLFTYLYMRELKSSTTSALFSGVAYMFCGFLVIWVKNTNVQHSLAWLPFILFLLEKIKNEKKFIYVILGSFSFAMLILAGYPQILTYTTMVILFYIAYITLLAKKDRFVILLYGILILVLGSLLGSIQLIPTKELVDLSIRAKITSDIPRVSFSSFKLSYLITFLFPYFFGSPNPGFYPAYNVFIKNFFFKAVGYIGILPLLFTFAALLKRKDEEYIVLFWVSISLLAFLLAMGNNTPLFPIICQIPFLNLFFNFSLSMFIPDFAIAILGGLGVEYLISGRRIDIRKKSAVFLIIALSILVITNPAIYMPILFMILAGIIYWFLSVRPRNRTGHVILIVILFADLFFFGHFLYQHSVKVDEFIHKDKNPPIFKFFRETESDPNNYRVFPVISHLGQIKSYDFVCPNLNILFPISTIVNRDPLFFKGHAKLLNARKNGTLRTPLHLAESNRIISLLNVKYLIVNPKHVTGIESMKAKTSMNNHSILPPFWGDLKSDEQKKEYVSLYERVFTSTSGTSIFKNRNVLPRAFLVAKVIPVKNFDAAYHILCDEKEQFDPSQEALVELKGRESFTNLTPGKATLISYKNSEVVIRTQSPGQSFLILSDTYYPGWKAFIDGRETTIYKTNGTTLIQNRGPDKYLYFNSINFTIHLLGKISNGP
ncbi:MAG: hypothetical protein JRF49_13090 [Deltaproteobacteria bacterium]|nr:hypothetical protein [Deltaproteobacteria bacterium]